METGSFGTAVAKEIWAGFRKRWRVANLFAFFFALPCRDGRKSRGVLSQIHSQEDVTIDQCDVNKQDDNSEGSQLKTALFRLYR
jgi:hypothetical protein